MFHSTERRKHPSGQNPDLPVLRRPTLAKTCFCCLYRQRRGSADGLAKRFLRISRGRSSLIGAPLPRLICGTFRRLDPSGPPRARTGLNRGGGSVFLGHSGSGLAAIDGYRGGGRLPTGGEWRGVKPQSPPDAVWPPTSGFDAHRRETLKRCPTGRATTSRSNTHRPETLKRSLTPIVALPPKTRQRREHDDDLESRGATYVFDVSLGGGSDGDRRPPASTTFRRFTA